MWSIELGCGQVTGSLSVKLPISTCRYTTLDVLLRTEDCFLSEMLMTQINISIILLRLQYRTEIISIFRALYLAASVYDSGLGY